MPLDANPQLGAFAPDGRRVFWSFSDHTILGEYTVPDRARERAGRPTGRSRSPGPPTRGPHRGHRGRWLAAVILCMKLKGPLARSSDVNAVGCRQDDPTRIGQGPDRRGGLALRGRLPGRIRLLARCKPRRPEPAPVTRVASPVRGEITALGDGERLRRSAGRCVVGRCE